MDIHISIGKFYEHREKYIVKMYMDYHIWGGENMAYTKAGMKAVDRYVRENYDRVGVKLPKGRKEDVEAHAKSKGQSVNGLINALLRADMGISEEEWKNPQEESGTR